MSAHYPGGTKHTLAILENCERNLPITSSEIAELRRICREHQELLGALKAIFDPKQYGDRKRLDKARDLVAKVERK